MQKFQKNRFKKTDFLIIFVENFEIFTLYLPFSFILQKIVYKCFTN